MWPARDREKRNLGSVRAFAAPGTAWLQASWGLSCFGHWAFLILLSLYAYDVGGAVAVGVVHAVRMLPAAVAAPFVALLADLFPRRMVLLTLLGARAAALAVLAAGVGAGLSLPVVAALAVVYTVLQTGHRPAQVGLFAELAQEPAQLGAANAAGATIDNLAFLLGAVVAAGLATGPGAATGFALTAAALATGALLVLPVGARSAPAHRSRDRSRSPGAELFGGMTTIWRQHGLKPVVAALAVLAFVEGATDVLVVVIALELTGLGEQGVGWLNAGWGVGGLIGGALAVVLLTGRRLARGMRSGAFLIGGALVVVAVRPDAWVALLALCVLGAGFSLIEVGGHTLLQRLAPDDVLARSFGALETAYQMANALGSIAAPALMWQLGGRGALAVVGTLLPMFAVLTWRTLSRYQADASVPADAYTLLRSLDVFAPLPVAVLESLAVAAQRREVAPGTVLMTQGDPATEFLAIQEGLVDVRVAGTSRPPLGPGDYFGEIALLRASSRTATVVARQPTALLAVSAEAFHAAVSGHHRSFAAVDATARTRQEATS